MIFQRQQINMLPFLFFQFLCYNKVREKDPNIFMIKTGSKYKSKRTFLQTNPKLEVRDTGKYGRKNSSQGL
jgi:hypothetical protein